MPIIYATQSRHAATTTLQDTGWSHDPPPPPRARDQLLQNPASRDSGSTSSMRLKGLCTFPAKPLGSCFKGLKETKLKKTKQIDFWEIISAASLTVVLQRL